MNGPSSAVIVIPDRTLVGIDYCPISFLRPRAWWTSIAVFTYPDYKYSRFLKNNNIVSQSKVCKVYIK